MRLCEIFGCLYDGLCEIFGVYSVDYVKSVIFAHIINESEYG